MTTKHKGQRVGVFVDVQNMYYSARQLYNAKVNFKEILKEAVKGRTLIRAVAYVIKADMPDEKNFHDALDIIGFEVRSKDLQIFVGGAKKGDWDVGIAMDCIELAPKLDVIVLISGDGDFIPLVEHLTRALGCRVEVMSFGRCTSAKLKEEAFEFFDMDANKSRFLIASRQGQRGEPGQRGARGSSRTASRPRSSQKAERQEVPLNLIADTPIQENREVDREYK
jgi:uncharacterized LabA/DUF88 family protein